MADKKIIFQLEIEGADVSVRTVNELTAAIKSTNEALKGAELGTDEYRKLERQLGQLKNAQKDVSDSAKLAQRQLEADANAGQNTYRQLNAQLVNARALFKELTAEERRGQIGQTLIADIKRLDTELKDIDATIGQFQRNVGNYAGGIKEAFGQIAPTLGQVVPGFSQLTDAATLVKDGIGQIGQSASATGKLLTGAFIGFQVVGAILDGVGAVREFVNEINNLRGQLQLLTGETGPALDNATAQVEALRNTFNAGTEETIQAANALDSAFSEIDLTGALDLIKEGFLSGADASGELLDVLKEYPRLFDQMGFSAEEFLTIQAKAAQEGVFSDKGVDAVKEFGIRIREQTVATRQSLEQAFGRDFTKQLFDNLNSGAITVRDALTQVSAKLRDTELPAKQLQQVISDVFGGPGEDAGDKFLKSLADIDQGLQGAAGASDEYTQRLSEQFEAESELSAAKVEAAKQLNELTGGYENLGTKLKTFVLVQVNGFLASLNDIPNLFRGIIEAGKQFAVNIGNFFLETATDAQIFYTEVRKLNPFNDNDAELSEQLDALKARKAEIQAAGKSVADAFAEGYNRGKKPELFQTKGVSAERKGGEPGGGGGNVPAGLDTEAAKKQAELNAAALEAQRKYADQRIELLRVLSRRFAEATIQAIDDESERQISAERQKFEDLKTELAKQEAQLIEQQRAARAKVVASFGEGSAQVQTFDAGAAADQEAAREAARRVVEVNEVAHLERIEQIRNDAANNAARAELERIKTNLQNREQQFDEAAAREETRVKEQTNRILNDLNLSDGQKAELIIKLRFEADQSSLQQEAIKINEQIAAVEARLTELSESDDLQQASIEEFAFLSEQLDALNDKRVTTELAYTELTQAEAQKRSQARASEAGQVIDTLGQIAQIADQFAAATAQRELANIAEKEQARQKSIDTIQNQLQTATGAEKKQLEARLKNEQAGLKKLEEERKKVQQEESKRQKSFAIIQAIINTAAGIAKTIATLGVPAGIPAAAIAAALGFAQVAIISAIPAATGALIGANIADQKPGLVLASQNIPELSNGDNVLATLRRGEVVLNKKQQAALGGAPTFRAIQVPGFAEGGAAGSVISAPDVTGTSTAERIRLLEKISGQVADGIEATNQRIDRLRAFVVSEDIREDLAEADTLEARATLTAG